MSPSETAPEVPEVPAEIVEARAVLARGGNPVWQRTYTHPKHGELTFKGDLPSAREITLHSVRMDNLLAELGGPGRGQTMVMAAALAGMTDGLLLDMPEVDRTEVPDDERGSVRVEIVRYDPEAELNVNWLMDVWLEFSEWRGQLLTPETLEAVGKS